MDKINDEPDQKYEIDFSPFKVPTIDRSSSNAMSSPGILGS